jgi:hypothetical protein
MKTTTTAVATTTTTTATAITANLYSRSKLPEQKE